PSIEKSTQRDIVMVAVSAINRSPCGLPLRQGAVAPCNPVGACVSRWPDRHVKRKLSGERELRVDEVPSSPRKSHPALTAGGQKLQANDHRGRRGIYESHGPAPGTGQVPAGGQSPLRRPWRG